MAEPARTVKDLIHEKAWDDDGVPWQETNVGGIGSDEDKALRKEAAETEPAWKQISKEKAGMWMWRIENFEVVEWPRSKWGTFHVKDSYIVLDVDECKDEDGNVCLSREIFFWLGSDTGIDQRGVAAYKTVELDDFFDGACCQHREVMKRESVDFQSLFTEHGGLHYMPGGAESGFEVALDDMYITRLFRVRKTREGDLYHMDEVLMMRESLNHRDGFILDGGLKIWLWFGDAASPFLKAQAGKMARKLEADRQGRAEVLWDPDDEFWRLLGGKVHLEDITPAGQVVDDEDEPDFGDGLLYRIHIDELREVHFEQVGRRALDRSMLDSSAIMMLWTRTAIFLWIGKNASELEKRNPTRFAVQYMRSNRLPLDTAVSVIKEGQGYKNKVWAQIFPRDQASKEASIKARELQENREATSCANGCSIS